MSIRWTIGQACVWLATADARAANGTSAWTPIPNLIDEIAPAHDRPTILSALAELQDYWRAGRLTITGRKRGKGEPEEINPPGRAIDWKLEIDSDDFVRLEPLDWLDRDSPAPPAGKPFINWWSDLTVSADAVQALWPAPVETPTPATVAIVATERRPSGRKPQQRNAARDWLALHYPDGLPAGVALAAIEAEMRADGVNASVRTIGRALGAK